MRQESKKKVTVRETVIGGAQPLICLPLVARDRESLLEQARELKSLNPDLLEWRIDGYEKVADIHDCLLVLKELRPLIDQIPLIFTCRIDREGGMQEISQQKRLELFKGAMESGDVDIVDIELCNEKEFIESVREMAGANKVALILSYHNFNNTPDEEFICNKLSEARKAGADIAKLAVMPTNYSDVLNLLSATNRARTGAVDIPMITISMGEQGGISRLAGGLFGSDITFGLGRESSAPGQMPIDDLRTGMALLYGAD
jgi:3-dehydroquinate dehydratase-1